MQLEIEKKEYFDSWVAKTWFGIARIFAFKGTALTLGKHIFYKYGQAQIRLSLRYHEEGHVVQYAKYSHSRTEWYFRLYGFIRFVLTYIILFVRHGYQKHPLELEADVYMVKRLDQDIK